MFFTELAGNNIGRLSPGLAAITEFPVPSGGPLFIAGHRDGTFWFTESAANKIGKFVPSPLSCSATIPAPVGNATATVTLYDAIGGAAGTGNKLAVKTTGTTFTASGPNTLMLTLDAIVYSVQIGFPIPGLITGQGVTVPVNVDVRDQAGAIIVGAGGYVDANGNALTINLANADLSGSTSLSTSSITSPTQTVTLTHTTAA